MRLSGTYGDLNLARFISIIQPSVCLPRSPAAGSWSSATAKHGAPWIFYEGVERLMMSTFQEVCTSQCGPCKLEITSTTWQRAHGIVVDRCGFIYILRIIRNLNEYEWCSNSWVQNASSHCLHRRLGSLLPSLGLGVQAARCLITLWDQFSVKLEIKTKAAFPCGRTEGQCFDAGGVTTQEQASGLRLRGRHLESFQPQFVSLCDKNVLPCPDPVLKGHDTVGFSFRTGRILLWPKKVGSQLKALWTHLGIRH